MATSFDVVGASVVVPKTIVGDTVTFRYRSTRNARMTLILGGRTTSIAFPDSRGSLATVSSRVDVPAQGTLILQRNGDDSALGLDLDWVKVSG